MKWTRLGEFFQTEQGRFSMTRIIAVTVIMTLCFDGVWCLVMLNYTWDFTIYKLLFAMFAMGGKIVEKFIEKLDLKELVPNILFKKRGSAVLSLIPGEESTSSPVVGDSPDVQDPDPKD